MIMVKVRQDAWSHEDDLLLAETVLRHIREGSTQLKAFDEVGDQLNRTSAACGFRWNAEIRQKYISAIDMAKRQRKEKKRAIAKMEKQAAAEKVEQRIFPSKESFAFEFAAETLADESISVASPAIGESEVDLDKVIDYLKSLKAKDLESGQTLEQIEELQKDNLQKTSEIEILKQELANTKQKLITVQEDYNTFIKLMDRARKMSFPEEEKKEETVFHQSKSPSLDQLIQNSN